MECSRCLEDKPESEFRKGNKICKKCVVAKTRENEELPLADNQIRAYGVVLTFDVNWKPSNLSDEKVLAIVADMNAGMGILKLVEKYKVPRDVIVDIGAGIVYADVTGIKLGGGE